VSRRLVVNVDHVATVRQARLGIEPDPVAAGRLNLEMAATQEMLKIALEVRPTSATLVPERREELTTEGGLDVTSQLGAVGEMVRALRDGHVRSCLFIDPALDQVKAAHRVGADSVEIHSGRYAEGGLEQSAEFRRIEDSVRLASKLGLEVGVGHGLGYANVRPLVGLRELSEFSIGHSIVSRAVLVGMERAVSEMKALVR
jgi:pyridoxine 5-phosphate synthase